jgi:hypothetical protein
MAMLNYQRVTIINHYKLLLTTISTELFQPCWDCSSFPGLPVLRVVGRRGPQHQFVRRDGGFIHWLL